MTRIVVITLKSYLAWEQDANSVTRSHSNELSYRNSEPRVVNDLNTRSVMLWYWASKVPTVILRVGARSPWLVGKEEPEAYLKPAKRPVPQLGPLGPFKLPLLEDPRTVAPRIS